MPGARASADRSIFEREKANFQLPNTPTPNTYREDWELGIGSVEPVGSYRRFQHSARKHVAIRTTCPAGRVVRIRAAITGRRTSARSTCRTDTTPEWERVCGLALR